MSFVDENIKKLYEEYRNDKIICGVKDYDVKIENTSVPFWIFVMIIITGILARFAVGFIVNEVSIFNNVFVKIIVDITTIFFIIAMVMSYYELKTELYFEDENIVFKNKLNKKIVIDINRYPRIYIKKSLYTTSNTTYSGAISSRVCESYDLHIEQDYKDLEISVDVIGAKKLKLFLDNLILKEKQESTNSQWECSFSPKEKKISEYISFLENPKKVIGVKDTTKKIKFRRLSVEWKIFIILVLTTLSCFGLDYIGNSIFDGSQNVKFTDFFGMAGAFLLVFDFLFLMICANQIGGKGFKVSYPTQETIKIKGNIFDYRNNDVLIGLVKYRPTDSFDKYCYDLKVFNNGVRHYFEVEAKFEKEIGEFIDNLIFEK